MAASFPTGEGPDAPHPISSVRLLDGGPGSKSASHISACSNSEASRSHGPRDSKAPRKKPVPFHQFARADSSLYRRLQDSVGEKSIPCAHQSTLPPVLLAAWAGSAYRLLISSIPSSASAGGTERDYSGSCSKPGGKTPSTCIKDTGGPAPVYAALRSLNHPHRVTTYRSLRNGEFGPRRSQILLIFRGSNVTFRG